MFVVSNILLTHCLETGGAITEACETSDHSLKEKTIAVSVRMWFDRETFKAVTWTWGSRAQLLARRQLDDSRAAIG